MMLLNYSIQRSRFVFYFAKNKKKNDRRKSILHRKVRTAMIYWSSIVPSSTCSIHRLWQPDPRKLSNFYDFASTKRILLLNPNQNIIVYYIRYIIKMINRIFEFEKMKKWNIHDEKRRVECWLKLTVRYTLTQYGSHGRSVLCANTFTSFKRAAVSWWLIHGRMSSISLSFRAGRTYAPSFCRNYLY